jgi:hypothetical protein
MEKEGIEALVEQILGCDDETFAKLKRAIGEDSREGVAEMVQQESQAASTARAIFAQAPVVGEGEATIADRIYPSAKRRKTKIEF